MTWTRQHPPLPEIHGEPLNYQLSTYLYHCREGGFDLSAPYQRGSVWTVDMRRALIRSLLMGIQPGAVYLSHLPYDPGRPEVAYRVIDGKQRIETVMAFAASEFSVPADWFGDDWLDPDQVDDGTVAYGTLSAPGRRFFDTLTMPAIVVDFTSAHIYVAPGTGTTGSAMQYTTRRRTADEILACEVETYLLLNTGGVQHTGADLDAARAAIGLEPVDSWPDVAKALADALALAHLPPEDDGEDVDEAWRRKRDALLRYANLNGGL